jgi:hypothetical protein
VRPEDRAIDSALRDTDADADSDNDNHGDTEDVGAKRAAAN